jgi:hypothetical protein
LARLVERAVRIEVFVLVKNKTAVVVLTKVFNKKLDPPDEGRLASALPPDVRRWLCLAGEQL